MNERVSTYDWTCCLDCLFRRFFLWLLFTATISETRMGLRHHRDLSQQPERALWILGSWIQRVWDGFPSICVLASISLTGATQGTFAQPSSLEIRESRYIPFLISGLSSPELSGLYKYLLLINTRFSYRSKISTILVLKLMCMQSQYRVEYISRTRLTAPGGLWMYIADSLFLGRGRLEYTNFFWCLVVSHGTFHNSPLICIFYTSDANLVVF